MNEEPCYTDRFATEGASAAMEWFQRRDQSHSDAGADIATTHTEPGIDGQWYGADDTVGVQCGDVAPGQDDLSGL